MKRKGHEGEGAHPLGGGRHPHGVTVHLEEAPEGLALDLQLAQVDPVDRGAEVPVEVVREALVERPRHDRVVSGLVAHEGHGVGRPSRLSYGYERVDHPAHAPDAGMGEGHRPRGAAQGLAVVDHLDAAGHHPEVAAGATDDARRHREEARVEPHLNEHQRGCEGHTGEGGEKLPAVVEERLDGDAAHGCRASPGGDDIGDGARDAHALPRPSRPSGPRSPFLAAADLAKTAPAMAGAIPPISGRT